MRIRPRILRANKAIRNIQAETHLSPSDFMAPLFVCEGKNRREEIASLAGQARLSLDLLKEEVRELIGLGIQAVLIFARVEDHLKNQKASEAINPNGLMQRTVSALREEFPELLIMTDVALDPYSSDGHDGLVEDGKIVNDKSVELLVKMAISHIEAGAHWVAPSDMMDGRVAAIREAFNERGWEEAGILSYSAKYASNLYGPFREALDSTPGFGDKKSYQMDFRNGKEAEKEARLDSEEGADMLMVKPGLFYLDVIRRISDFASLPVAVYQVSGEYAMIKAAAEKGWLNETEVMMESLYAFKRAGASLIVSYFAKEACRKLKSIQ